MLDIEQLNADIYRDLEALLDKYRPMIGELTDSEKIVLASNFIVPIQNMMFFLKENARGALDQ